MKTILEDDGSVSLCSEYDQGAGNSGWPYTVSNTGGPLNPAGGSPATEIARECREISEMLLKKNSLYGNSALDPIRLFSSADPAEQLRVRIDDKLSRLKRGAAGKEDSVLDLIGYLILLRIAERYPSTTKETSK